MIKKDSHIGLKKEKESNKNKPSKKDIQNYLNYIKSKDFKCIESISFDYHDYDKD